jgi:group I intron endonuclease
MNSPNSAVYSFPASFSGFVHPLAEAHLRIPRKLKIGGIYYIINRHNSKLYIGRSVNLKKRFKEHSQYLRHSSHHNIALQRSFNLHGIDAFDIGVLELCDSSDSAKLEGFYINKYQSLDSNFGYNLQPITESGTLTMSDESKIGLRDYHNSMRNGGGYSINWEIVEEIRNLYASGETVSKIAEKFNRKRSFIRAIAENLTWHDPSYIKRSRKSTARQFSKEVEKSIIDLRSQGVSYDKIDQQLGLCKSDSFKFAKRNPSLFSANQSTVYTQLLDLDTGIYYDSVAEVIRAKGISRNVLYSSISGEVKNKTSIIKV